MPPFCRCSEIKSARFQIKDKIKPPHNQLLLDDILIAECLITKDLAAPGYKV